VVNAGCANSFTGKPGADAARRVASAVAKRFGVETREILAASTGGIGVLLDDAKIARAMPDLSLHPVNWFDAASAIMTTDTFPKGAGRSVEIAGQTVHLAGIAKGSGMIAPNMATMLVFLFTDAALSPSVAQALISKHVDLTFNTITVDGDTSTSDTLLLFATGASGAPLIEDAAAPRLAPFEAALHAVMLDVALQVVKDGEGAEKLIRIEITGAQSDASARRIGLSIGNSPLLKTAVAGGDANWGRVVMAVGKSGEPIALDKLAIRMGGVWTARDGGAIAYDTPAVDAHFAGREIDILVDVGLGGGRAVVWTCDLTKRYIEINGDYRS